MYMPTVARFTARDPLPEEGEPILLGVLPPYAYADGKPATEIDPSGKSPICTILSGLCYCYVPPKPKPCETRQEDRKKRKNKNEKCLPGWSARTEEEFINGKLTDTNYICIKDCDTAADCSAFKDQPSLCKIGPTTTEGPPKQKKTVKSWACQCLKK